MSDATTAAAARIIRDLGLVPHPEGGHYRETFRAEAATPRARPALSMIYFLLASGERSLFHRIDADEAWHHYDGDDLALHVIAPDGAYRRDLLGRRGPWQSVVRAGSWFAAEPVPGPVGYTLVGCDVAPAFGFDGFALASRAELTRLHPEHAELVRRLTPDP